MGNLSFLNYEIHHTVSGGFYLLNLNSLNGVILSSFHGSVPRFFSFMKVLLYGFGGLYLPFYELHLQGCCLLCTTLCFWWSVPHFPSFSVCVLLIFLFVFLFPFVEFILTLLVLFVNTFFLFIVNFIIFRIFFLFNHARKQDFIVFLMNKKCARDTFPGTFAFILIFEIVLHVPES